MKQCLQHLGAIAALRQSGASEAAGLQSKLESPSFVILRTVEKLLRITTAFPEQLQDSGMILLRAVNLVKAAIYRLHAVTQHHARPLKQRRNLLQG